MASYNKVIMVGNLTRDIQLSFLPSGVPAGEAGIATNRKWTKDGEKREEVCFIDLRVYGKQAETMSQYCQKGSPILIEGRLQLDQWEDKQGQKRSKHRIVVERFQFLGTAQDSAAPQPASQDVVGDDTPF